MDVARLGLVVGFALTLRGGVSAEGQSLPNDPDFSRQWWLQNTGQVIEESGAGLPQADIDVLGAWEIHAGSMSVLVGIVGTGVDPHPEFADRLLEGRATIGDPFDSLDVHHIGTAAAGIIGALKENGLGIAGITNGVRLLPIRAMEGVNSTPAAVAEGIVWAVDQGAGVIVVLFHFAEGSEQLLAAVDYASQQDVVLVAGVGNGAAQEPWYPAAYGQCLAVSATDNRDALASFSNFGPHVDLAAPGQDIYSTWPDGKYGTDAERSSMAAAVAAGTAALIRSCAPQLSAGEVIDILQDTADDLGAAGADDLFGAGRVNARSALAATPRPVFRFDHVERFPSQGVPGLKSKFLVDVVAGDETALPDVIELRWRGEGESLFRSTQARRVVDGRYEVALPAAPCEARIEYYLVASDGQGAVVTDPLRAPDETYSFVATRVADLLDDDMETEQGWTTAIDGGEATRGGWVAVEPVATIAQPGYDYSPDEGRRCFVTGRTVEGSPGLSDVDGGPVRLISPPVSIAPADAADVMVRYARWFFTSGKNGDDRLSVDVSRDGGATWAVVETVASSEAMWVSREFRLSSFPQLTGAELVVRFSVMDPAENDSLTEAAIDEFHVQAILCASTMGDFDGDGTLTASDFAQLQRCLAGPAEAPETQRTGQPWCGLMDINGDGLVDLRDAGDFANRFGL